MEAVILELPYVKTCVVISVGAEGEDKQLAAYVVLKENITRKQMRADLKKQLPFYMVPSYFVYLPRYVLNCSLMILSATVWTINRI